MKLYQAIRLEKSLSDELNKLHNRFRSNNCISVNELRDYEPNVLLEEIKKKTDELIRIGFLIEKSKMNIREIVLRNTEYEKTLETLRSTPTSMSKDSINAFTRTELDKIITEYENKIKINKDSIDYYEFITDVDI